MPLPAVPAPVDVWRDRPQASRRKARCRITVNGVDVTANIDPHLISLIVVDKAATESDTCAIELDDRDGRLEIPYEDAEIKVELGWHSEAFYVVFVGRVEKVESGFGRKHGGRRLWIDAVGTATRGEGFTPRQVSWGEGAPPGKLEGTKIPLSAVLADVGKLAGIEIAVLPSLGKIERDYWAMTSESAFQFVSRLASELGATFKVANNKASFTSVVSFDNAFGKPMPWIMAVWGENLIDWRIMPYAGRTIWDGAKAEYFDHTLSQWKSILQPFNLAAPFNGATGVTQLPAPAPNAQVAAQFNGGMHDNSRNKRGVGWVTINGEPQALAGSKLTIVGARKGVDANYSIEEAHHLYSRNGYTTRCKLDWPELAENFK